jgi:endonuclease/exonuclease/phosphatase (EEP) superfamily protein YafD
MTVHPASDRFTVHCVCGELIHSTDEHIGRSIRCRCGRKVELKRPAASAPPRDETRHRDGGRRDGDSGSRRRHGESHRHGARGTVLGVDHGRLGGMRRRLSAFAADVSDVVYLVSAELTHRSLRTRLTAWSTWAWLLSMLVTWALIATMSDRWLPATMLAYGPRWVALLPLLVLLPACLLRSRRSLPVLVLGAVVALVPVMGFAVSIPRAGLSPSSTVHAGGVRIVSLNASGGGVVARRLTALLAQYNPQVLSIQECGPELADSLAHRAGWHVIATGSLCTASLWPVAFVDSMPASGAFGATFGSANASAVVAGELLRVTVARPAGAFHVINVHLEPTRTGVRALLHGDDVLPYEESGMGAALQTGNERRAQRIDRRERDMEQAAAWAQRDVETPTIVAGDFNVPSDTYLYRRYWRALENAFDARGVGMGVTRVRGLLRDRIDHVLVTPAFLSTRGAWVGPDVGADHRPVIVDLEARR